MAGIHLLKLCVGCESVEDLLDWQAARAAERRAGGVDPRPFHVTRMWPKRGDELLDGGSLYWVVKGLVLCRQRVVALERQTGDDGIERCRLRLDPEIVRTTPQPRRAFQGWRYLRPTDAPADLALASAGAPALPAALAAGLAEIGVL
jgi:hypothetical protein